MDDLFVLDRDGSAVRVTELPFAKEGDVSGWLSSTVFAGAGSRSKEAELAIDAAMDFMANRLERAELGLRELSESLKALRPTLEATEPPTDLQRPLVERVHDALVQTLPGHDRFWARWVRTWEQHEAVQELTR